MFSDGVQTLVLNYVTRTAVEGFFRPIAKELRAAVSDNLDEFETRLVSLLSSDQVNKKTDDDKTLVICVQNEC